MTCEFRTLLIVTTCFATCLVGCGKRETPGPTVVEHDSRPETVVQTKAPRVQETPAVAKAATENTRPAERSAVTLIEQLGATVTEDLNSFDKPIIKVSLRDRPVNDKGLKAIDEFKDLEELDLSSCRQITDDGLVHIAGLTNLKELVLWNTTISGRGLEHIAGLQQLEILNVALCAKIGDDDLKPFGRLTKLRELDLASVGGVTDTGLSSLKPLTHLRWLNLYNAKITDAGLEHLYGLTELETIVLNGTKVTDDGVEKLKAALPKLREIQR